LSFRLHCLYEAVSTERLPAEVRDVDIRNHWLQLLSELVRLYGYSEPEVKKMVEEALPQGRRDVLGFQGELYYVPRSPLLPVRLLGAKERDRYDQLKERVRKGNASQEMQEFARLQRVLRWETLANGGVPHRLVPTPWPGLEDERQILKAASSYLSRKRGQSYTARNPRRVDASNWEVEVIHTPMSGDGGGVTSLPASSKLGTLHVNGITGKVSGNCEGTQNAACS
jgi:hypothetical protein